MRHEMAALLVVACISILVACLFLSVRLLQWGRARLFDLRARVAYSSTSSKELDSEDSGGDQSEVLTETEVVHVEAWQYEAPVSSASGMSDHMMSPTRCHDVVDVECAHQQSCQSNARGFPLAAAHPIPSEATARESCYQRKDADLHDQLDALITMNKHKLAMLGGEMLETVNEPDNKTQVDAGSILDEAQDEAELSPRPRQERAKFSQQQQPPTPLHDSPKCGVEGSDTDSDVGLPLLADGARGRRQWRDRPRFPPPAAMDHEARGLPRHDAYAL